MKDFCIEHYLTSDIYDDDEKTSLEFYEAYHGCLQQSGRRKGKKYCEDILSTDPTSDLSDLFNCYEIHLVDIDSYGETKCRYENPY